MLTRGRLRLEAVIGFAGRALRPGRGVLESDLIGFFGFLNGAEFDDLMDVVDGQPDFAAGAPVLVAHVDAGADDEGALAHVLQLRTLKYSAAGIVEADDQDFAGKILCGGGSSWFGIFRERGEGQNRNGAEAEDKQSSSQ